MKLLLLFTCHRRHIGHSDIELVKNWNLSGKCFMMYVRNIISKSDRSLRYCQIWFLKVDVLHWIEHN